MSEIAVQLLIVLLLVLVNGVFAMSEIAVVASRKIRLERRADQGDKGAAAALALARAPTQFLSTVQVGITLVGVLAGAFGAAALSDDLSTLIAGVPLLARYADQLSLAVVVGGITYLSLIVGELVPKRIALGAPERIASVVARPMRMLSRATSPLVKLLTGSTDLMIRLLGVRPHAEPGITEDEIRAVLEQGAESGAVPRAEQEIVESVFRLGDRNAGAIMTPRPEVEWIDLADDDAEAGERLTRRLTDDRRAIAIVCDDDLDHVVGVVHASDLLARCLEGVTIDREALRAAATPPLFVPTAMPALELVERFRATHQHVAVVLDEYGGVNGVVSLHDVLEAILGDLPRLGEAPEMPEIVQRGDGSWLVEGTILVGDLEAALDLDLSDGARTTYQTLAGFVLARLTRMPETGDSFAWRGHRFEVVDMDGRRVDKVLIVPMGEEEVEAEGGRPG